ncbi:LysR family transcriptional regulator [Sinirhodobacter populi]|uniref:LysR family transcriptional regulator n=1 Tax=Paenirhodobacter populi TaxID=2306993 RepID=A0A443KKR0_9RHOB|nr:LysR family transcriptional regulator [Sinirhodobacter populi]RWR33372.1 LysR family transcriptional regulator [Sinirhodobacter populi]
MDRLTEMEAFIAVVDQGGFTGAARRMEVSKSAISKYVAALEQRLGTRLLERTTRRVEPTEIGIAYYRRVRRIVHDAEEADAMAGSTRMPPTGRLRVSVPAEFGVTRFVPVLGGLLMDYPGLSIHTDLRQRNAAPVASAEHDLTLSIDPEMSRPAGSRLLARSAHHLVAAPEYVARHGAPARIEELTEHALLHRAQDTAAEANLWHLISASGESRTVRCNGPLTANDDLALLEACLNGYGIACLPGYLTGERLRDGQLVPIIPTLAGQALSISILSPESEFTPPKVTTLIDYLSSAYGTQSADWQ